MKNSIIFMMLCALMGCAQQSLKSPPVSGNAEPVNSPAMIKEMNNVSK